MVVSLWVGVGHCSTEIPWQDFSREAHGGDKLTSYPYCLLLVPFGIIMTSGRPS